MNTIRLLTALMFLPLLAAAGYAQNAGGVYESDFNQMTLQQDGAAVTGTYEYSGGRIEGTMSGHTLSGTWIQSNGKGRMEFVFNADFSAFEGKWGYNDDAPSRQWNGKRKAGSPDPASSPAPEQPEPEGTAVFNNWNKAAVADGPSAPTCFYLAQRATITRITNYHWNSGGGKEPGKIGIRNAEGAMLGTWQAVATSGTGGAPNVNWIVTPGIVLDPGLYRITDSDPETWSHNAGSFAAGFSIIQAK